jgi:hypothetical protein
VAEAEFDGAGWDALRAQVSAGPEPDFALKGADVVALGVPPGPAVGAALKAMRAWWIAGDCAADRKALLAELRRMVEGAGAEKGGAADGPAAPQASAGT